MTQTQLIEKRDRLMMADFSITEEVRKLAEQNRYTEYASARDERTAIRWELQLVRIALGSARDTGTAHEWQLVEAVSR